MENTPSFTELSFRLIKKQTSRNVADRTFNDKSSASSMFVGDLHISGIILNTSLHVKQQKSNRS